MKFKKTIIAILLCIAMSVSLFTLVACGGTDDDSDTSSNYQGESFNGIDMTLLDDIMNSIIDYGIYYTKANPNYAVSAFGAFDEFYSEEGFGVGCLGWIEVFKYLVPIDEYPQSEPHLYLCLYDTKEHAEAAMELVIDMYREDNLIITQKDNCIICESDGFYDEVFSQSVPECDKNNSTVKLVKSSLYKELQNSDNRFVGFDEFRELITLQGKIASFGISAEPKIGNRTRYYGLRNIDMYEQLFGDDYYNEANWQTAFNEEKKYYTDDSYSNYTTINGDKYLTYCMQYKAGTVFFEDYKDCCGIREIYYDNIINIPSLHDGKPVKYVDLISFYDTCDITDAYFDGTIEQWNEIHFRYGNLKNCTVHCADGVIEL